MIDGDPMALYMYRRLIQRWSMIDPDVVRVAAQACRDFMREAFPVAAKHECGCDSTESPHHSTPVEFPEEGVPI